MERSFVLLALMQALGVERLVHIDSDVLVLVSFEHWLRSLEELNEEVPHEAAGLWLRPRQSHRSWHWSAPDPPLLPAPACVVRVLKGPQ